MEEHIFPKTVSGPHVHLLERSPTLSGRVIEVSWKTPMRKFAVRRQKNDGGPCQNSRSDIALLVTMEKWKPSSNREQQTVSHQLDRDARVHPTEGPL